MSAKVVSFIGRKAEKKLEEMTPEQKLKMFTINQMVGEDAAAKLLMKFTVDEAFKYIAEMAVFYSKIKVNQKA